MIPAVFLPHPIRAVKQRLMKRQSNPAKSWSLLFLLLAAGFSNQAGAQSDSFITVPFGLTVQEKQPENPITFNTTGQNFSPQHFIPSFRFPGDSLTKSQQKCRTWTVTGINVLGYGGVMTALAAAWYDDYQKTRLHSFDDSKEWLQMDKIGHFYGTWVESRANNEMWKWTGMDRKKRIWISGLTSFAFQTTIEYLDGRSAKWGWSWADMGANVLGSGTFIAQELAWDEQKIKLKWSFHRKKYNDPGLNQRSNELFGKSSPERFLKDYNGQSYWASAPLKLILPKSNIPAWLCFAVGYGAEGMFGGTDNLSRDENGTILFDRRDIKRYRQWYLAPDIDWSAFRTKSRALRILFTVLSAFKFPAPSLELSAGKLRLKGLVF